jgi:hypothetical protein
MRLLGIILIVAGALSLIYKGITYTKQEKLVDIGPIQASVDKQKTIPFSPVMGGVLLATGVVLVLADRRSARA